MAIQIADGFQLRVAKPLDDRQNVETVAQLDPTYGYEGQIVYVKDIKQFYTCYKDGNGNLAYKVMETVAGGGDLTDYQNKTDNTLTTTDKTIVGAINEVKDSIITNYKDLTNKPSIEGVELDGNKSLSDLGITIYDDTEVKSDIASLNEYKQNKTDNTLDTTDKTITGAINEVNDNLLDTVGFSADYKNIILSRKNGLNPYTIPISAIINNASLAELKDVDSTDVGDGKILVYDGTTNKHKYVDSSITDELVKMDNTTDANYLINLIDKSTVVNDNGVLKVKKLDGQEVTIREINYLKGLTMNIMDLVNAFSNGGVKVWKTPVNTYSDLETLDRSTFTSGISYIVYVLIDETHSNAKTTYLCTKTSTTFFGNADNQRNFTTNPIDLANEVTGKLDNRHIDVDNLWTLLTINDTYKTLTTNNEVFGTHGAKAMYDELTTAIGAKANATDLTTHTGDANIHVTTTDKAKWDKVTDKLNVADFNTHKNNTDIHITSAERTKWDKVTDKLNVADFNTHKNNTDIHITSAERTKWDKVDKKVDKTSITTTINSSSTDDEVPSAKAVNDILSTITSVADVPKTVIVSENTDVKLNSNCCYTVINGICYVSLWGFTCTEAGQYIINSSMPKTRLTMNGLCTYGKIGYEGGTAFINFDDNKLYVETKVTNEPLYGSFSYPVKE